MGNSRATNTIYNFTSSIGGQLITVIMQFIVRTVFITYLGKSYLGISGLFSNILTMLSLAEFGVGNAIIFKLYKPIAKQDEHRITILMKFYKKVYTAIGVLVTVIGLFLIPFLPLVINDYDSLATLNINAVLIFILYLAQTVVSYLFFAYKTAIIQAHQKEYIINIIIYAVTITTSLVQIIALMVFHSFELYVLILVVSVIVQNFACAKLADRLYPYINHKTDDKIDKCEIKEIVKDCAALFLYKLNGVVLKATDNIIISTFLGLELVGLYSNYYVFYTTIRTLFTKIFNAVSHSLGNLHATRDIEHEYKVYEATNLVTAILGGTACVGLFVVADEFILAWIGSDWVIPKPFALLMGIEVYTLAQRLVMSKFRNTMGLFQQAKYRPVAGMLINLVVSVFLVKFWGICGVLVGTIVADWSTLMWFDPIIIHKHGFNDMFSVKRYFLKNIQYIGIIAGVAIIVKFICSRIGCGLGWWSIIIHATICLIFVPGVLMLFTIKTEEGHYVLELGKKEINKAVNKIRK